MLRFAALVAVAAAAALATAEVDSTSGHYNGVQTSYGAPPVQGAYGVPPPPPPPPPSSGYESHHYEPTGYGVDPAYSGGDLFSDPFGSVVGYKLSAVGVAVKALVWLLAHSWAIILGAVTTFAFCKVTAACDLSYHKHAAEHLHEQVRSLVTPERLASASRMLDAAINKFAAPRNTTDS